MSSCSHAKVVVPLRNTCILHQKFRKKFWLLVDVKNKYLFNALPHLEKDPTRTTGTSVPEDVCVKLLQSVYNLGYHVTTYSYFTIEKLAISLKNKQISLLGTIRRQCREVPNCDNLLKDKPLFTSLIYRSHNDITLTAYKVKNSKSVYLLSTLHKIVLIDAEQWKQLPETVKCYNSNKTGVDTLDQMARYHTAKSATRRWPMAVFFNCLDLATINAWVLFRKVTGSTISQRDFLLQLISSLCDFNVVPAQPPLPPNAKVWLNKRRQCQIGKKHCENKSSAICHYCKMVCYGKHT